MQRHSVLQIEAVSFAVDVLSSDMDQLSFFVVDFCVQIEEGVSGIYPEQRG